ncbi:MAG: MFS transporter [Pseudomonadota bacterium]
MSTTTTMQPPQGLDASRSAAVLAIIVTSYLMIVVDISIVITGLPKIQRGLGFTHAGLSWVQNTYTLAFGGLLLLGARAGDILGRRRMFIAGIAVFTLASMAIGLAQSPTWLLASRAVQGMGAAILAPSTLALISTHFPEGPQRTRAMSYYAAAAGVGASLGLVLGGLAADLISWRAGFFINIPIGIALIWGAAHYIQETPKRPGQLDLPGALTSTVGMVALVYGIVRAAESGWTEPTTLISLTIGVVMLGLFVLNESRAGQPILPLQLFASRERSAAYATRMLFLGGMVGFWFFTTQYLQGVMGLRPLAAGLAFLPVTIPNFIAAMMVPRLTKRFGNERVLAVGMAIGVVGVAWLGLLSAHTPYITGVALPMILIGIGQGGVLGPLTVSAVAGVAGKDAGAASGVVNVAHQLGGSIGLGVLVVVFEATVPGATAAPEQLARRVAATFNASAVMLLLALIVVLAFIVLPKARKPLPKPVHNV